MKSTTALGQFLFRSGIIITLITMLTYGLLYQYITSEYRANYDEQIKMATGLIKKAIESRQVATAKLEREIDEKMRMISKAISMQLKGRPVSGISSQELKALTKEWGLYGISLLVKTGDTIKVVQSSEEQEIGLDTKQWGYWHTAFQQLFADGKVTLAKGYAADSFWVGPVSKSEWDAGKFFKYAYYYDGTTEFIINTYIQSDNIDRLVLFSSISDLLTELNNKYADIMDITVVNGPAWLKGQENKIIEPKTDVPYLYGANRFVLAVDREKISALLLTQESQGHNFTCEDEILRKLYIPLPNQRVLILVQSEKRLDAAIVKLNMFIVSLLMVSAASMIFLLRTGTRKQLLALKVQRKRLELAEQYKQTMDMLPNILFTCKQGDDGNMLVTYLEGVSLQKIGGSTIYEPVSITDDRVFPAFREYERELLQAFQGETVSYEMNIGEECYQMTVKPVLDFTSNSVTGIAGYATDITERVRLEKELKAARDNALDLAKAKSTFLAMMSHELRTPLHSAGGMLELLGETSLTTEQRHYLQTAMKAGKTLNVLINDLLELTRLEFRQIHLEKQPFSFSELISDVIEIMSVLTDRKSLSLSYEISPEVPPVIVGDSKRIRQILINLVGNAIKFTERGSVTLRVEKTEEGTDGLTLRFAVQDTGIGIAPEHLKTIFDQFVQADASISRRFGGSGLGLTISKYLIEMMGGVICVESQLGKGSTFSFTIQAKRSQEEPDVAGAEELEKPMDTQEEASPLKILLVDDREENRNLMKAYLSKCLVQVEEAENGLDAIELFRSRRYDLVLMDIQMPVMDGYQATEAIRKWEAEQGLPPTPVIALTANSLPDDIQQSLRVGCTTHLIKPVTRKDLYQCLRQFVPLVEEPHS